MNTPSFLSLSAIFLCFAVATPALAQSEAQQRLDRLQREIQLLQKQVARGENITPQETMPVDNSIASLDNPAQLEVRLSAMDEEIRRLRGRVEESEFQSKRLAETLEKLQKDVDFRLNELSAGKPPVANGGAPDDSFAATANTNTPAAAAAEEAENFASPKEHYNHAFRLLNQTKYDEAARAFESFTKKHPNDPLIGNAYYWQGETYYIRRDYVASADAFRQGFEALPTGPKAPDNLLKLAMSLAALDRSKEACVVLTQLGAKFKKTPSAANVLEKSAQEQKRIGCK